jgi:hypothetical protein
MADCMPGSGHQTGPGPFGNLVTTAYDGLGPGDAFPGNPQPPTDPNAYVLLKELFLASVVS